MFLVGASVFHFVNTPGEFDHVPWILVIFVFFWVILFVIAYQVIEKTKLLEERDVPKMERKAVATHEQYVLKERLSEEFREKSPV